MVLRTSSKFKYNDGSDRKFYGCSRWPACTGTHGAHPDGSPHGFPADKATKVWRMRAHEQFDQLWKTGRLTRKQSYRFLQQLMDLDEDAAHIAKFGRLECERLIQLIECGVAEAKLEDFLSSLSS